jgi:multidrug resistance efflux pump
MRIKDTIKAAKKAIKLAEKNPMLYTDEEIVYMKRALRQAKIDLQRKRELLGKGFKNGTTTWTSKVSVSDAPGGTDDGVRGEGEQSSEPGEP